MEKQSKLLNPRAAACIKLGDSPVNLFKSTNVPNHKGAIAKPQGRHLGYHTP